MLAYKLFRVRKKGTLGSLFINRRAVLPLGQWMEAEAHETKGYAYRPGWHALAKPVAPHLSLKGREWYQVEIDDYEEHTRPESQGGKWFVAQRLKILGKVPDTEFS